MSPARVPAQPGTCGSPRLQPSITGSPRKHQCSRLHTQVSPMLFPYPYFSQLLCRDGTSMLVPTRAPPSPRGSAMGTPCCRLGCLWKVRLSQMLKTCILWVIFQFISYWY